VIESVLPPTEDRVALDSKAKTLALGPEELGRLRSLGRTNLYFLSKAILGYDRFTPGFHGEMCSFMERASSRRKLLTVPRDFYKTTTVKSYVIKLILNNPEIRILIVKNTSTNAEKDLIEIQSHFEKNVLFRALYPEVIPTDFKKVRWNSQELEVPRQSSWSEATVEAIGYTGKAVGRHFDVIIEDDMLAPEEGSEVTKEIADKVIAAHKLLKFVFVNWRDGESIVIGNRWAHYDLVSWIRENEKYYDVYHRAAVEDGKAIFPEQFDLETLHQLEVSLGPYIYSCQMMNNPVDAAKQVFKQEWLEQFFYDEPARGGYRILIIDPAYSIKKTGDFTGTVVVDVDADYNVDIIHAEQERIGSADLMDKIFGLQAQFLPHVVGCEMVSSAKVLTYTFEEEMRKRNQWFYIEPLDTGGVAKEIRIRSLQPLFARRQIRAARHMTDLVNQLKDFPFGKHDDIIDALSYVPKLWAPGNKPAEPNGPDDPFSLQAIIRELHSRGRQDQYPFVMHNQSRFAPEEPMFPRPKEERV